MKNKISAGENCCIYCYRRDRTLRLVQLKMGCRRCGINWSNPTKVCGACRKSIDNNPVGMNSDGWRYAQSPPELGILLPEWMRQREKEKESGHLVKE